jgi:hypothetical protein
MKQKTCWFAEGMRKEALRKRVAGGRVRAFEFTGGSSAEKM